MIRFTSVLDLSAKSHTVKSIRSSVIFPCTLREELVPTYKSHARLMPSICHYSKTPNGTFLHNVVRAYNISSPTGSPVGLFNLIFFFLRSRFPVLHVVNIKFFFLDFLCVIYLYVEKNEAYDMMYGYE